MRISGPLILPDVGQRAQRHHLPLDVADLQLADLLHLVAEAGVGLDDHLPGAAEAIEVVDVQRAEAGLQGVEDGRQRHAHRHALEPVDVGVELRGVGAEDVRLDDQQRLLRISRVHLFAGHRRQVVGLRLERLQAEVAAVFDHQLEPAGAADAADRRRREHADHRLGNLLDASLLQLVGDLGRVQPRLLTLGELVEDHEHRAEVRVVGAEDERLAGHRHRVLDPRRVQAYLLHAIGDLPGPFDRAAASGSCTFTIR